MRAAERIYLASTGGEATSRMAEELARRIEDDIAAAKLAAGSPLGSLRDLCARYRSGRSVVREAVGLLEQRGLGRMRPGPFGGLMLAVPTPGRSGGDLADHLRGMGVTLRQFLDAREAVDLMTARRAARACPRDIDLQRLREQPCTDLSAHLEIRIGIARLADEPALLLMVECLNALTRDFQIPLQTQSTVRADAAAELLRALTRADESAAVAAAGRLHAELVPLVCERGTGAGSGFESPRPLLSGGTRPAAIARAIANDIAHSLTAGARIGSEWELCERFAVSRLTLRQAIRLLQDSGPAAGGIRLMLAYLIGAKLQPLSAGTILFELNSYTPVFAASRADVLQRQELHAALQRLESLDTFERDDLLGLVHCVARLADSPVIDLFSRCLAAYEARFSPTLVERLPASAQARYFELVRRLLGQLPLGETHDLTRAKRESAAVMLEMSRSRPL
jgi:DNA-binding FadR family transcriptional regulator